MLPQHNYNFQVIMMEIKIITTIMMGGGHVNDSYKGDDEEKMLILLSEKETKKREKRPGLDPPISNALMAALKRAQAHQRRGCPEQQQQPLLAVKVELEPLIISILDDPSVSRVMREASLSSPAVKATIEQSLNSSSATSANSGPIGLGFRPVAAAASSSNRNMYLNPRLQQGGAAQSGQQRSDEVKKVVDNLLRSKKRNPVLVGKSEPEQVVKEILRRVENKDIDGALRNVEVVRLDKDFALDKAQMVAKIKQLGVLVEARIGNLDCGGVILDLGDLKWLVEQQHAGFGVGPAAGGGMQQQVVSDVGRAAVAEMAGLLERFGEGGGGGRLWLIGTATCETYLRCQIYHPSMENDWDLQAVPIAAIAPLPGMFPSLPDSAGRLDHYSTTVDSPCWKGAPASHNTPFQSSEVLSTQFINNQEAYSDANSPAPWFTPVNTANVAKVSFEKPGETLTCDEDRCLQDGLMPCTGKFLVSGMPLRGGKSDDSRKIGSYNGKARCGCAIKFSKDTTQLIEANIITKKSIHEYDLKPSHTMQQSLKEGRMPSQRLDSPKSGVEDVGMKLNDVLECGPSHMSLHPMENMSSSPYSAEDIPSKLANYFGKESIQTMDIHLIVNTVHNLSELLLYYSSNEACGLKEQDYVTLKSVINNLDRCLAKNMRQESLLVELDKSMSMGKPHVGACDIRARPDNGHLQDKSLHFGKKDEGVSDNFGVKNDAEIKRKDDKITQTIKKVLSENFQVEEIHPQTLLYKNLWLEAEASLCSMNYIARYNRMKLEMKQCKLDSAKVSLEESTREENLSYSKFSNSTKTDNKSTPAFKDHVPTVDASIPHFPIISSSSCADDVVARFNILKGRDGYSGSGDARDVENVPGFEMYSTLDKAMDSSNPDLSVLESPKLSTSSDTDAVEASVMARFHILKCRDDISVSEKLEEQVVRGDVLDLSFAGDREQCPETDERAENEILDVNVKGVEQLDVADHAEYELAVKNEPVIQSPRSYVLGNHFSVSCSESCSSDWEHVLKEDIPR